MEPKKGFPEKGFLLPVSQRAHPGVERARHEKGLLLADIPEKAEVFLCGDLTNKYSLLCV